jgi:hypothetical protein
MILQWMITPTCGSVDAVWGVVVTALAAGLLGSSAKVSSKDREGGDHSQTHVICVYVDPFWDDNEMLRVLRGLREHCGISEELKFKADGATLLNIYKDNALGIPPCFFVSNAGSLAFEPLVSGPQTVQRRNCVHFRSARGCARGGACRFAHVQGGDESK